MKQEEYLNGIKNVYSLSAVSKFSHDDLLPIYLHVITVKIIKVTYKVILTFLARVSTKEGICNIY